MTKAVQVKHLSDLIMLRAIRDRWERKMPTPDIALIAQFPLKVIMAKMEQLVDRKLMECGVSVRTGWLTDEGKEYLIELESNQ